MPLGRENLNISQAKKGAASEGQVPAKKEAVESPSSIPVEQLLKAVEEIMDKKLKGLEEGQKKLGDCIEALESNQLSRVMNTVHKRRSPVSETTTPQSLGDRKLPHLNSSRGRQYRRRTVRRSFFKRSSRGSNHRRRRRPNHRHSHTLIHSPSLPQNLFWLADSTNLFLPRLENRHTDPSRLPEVEI